MSKNNWAIASVYFPDADDYKQVRDAAKLAGVPASTFMAQAIVAEAKRAMKRHGKTLKKRCPTCGTQHAA